MIYAVLELLITVFVSVFVFIFLLGVYKYATTKKVNLNGKHVVVTGGSSGIGKSLAVEAAKRGAHVTIVARNQERLDSALKEIFQAVARQQQRIQTVSLDVSSNYDEIKEKLMATENLSGPIYMLVNCAGTALCGVLDDVSESQIKSQFNINTVGSILPTKAVLSSMKAQRDGRIVLVASQAAYCGIYGFTVYSASKFALRGFAEALNMEVRPYNIKVTVSYPPDTDTPGFQEEEKTKPKETKLISDSSGLYQPQQVANKILDDALAGRFACNLGLDGFLLEHLCCGMSPLESLFDLAIQVCSLGLLRCVALGFNFHFQRIVRNCYLERTKEEKQD